MFAAHCPNRPFPKQLQPRERKEKESTSKRTKRLSKANYTGFVSRM